MALKRTRLIVFFLAVSMLTGFGPLSVRAFQVKEAAKDPIEKQEAVKCAVEAADEAAVRVQAEDEGVDAAIMGGEQAAVPEPVYQPIKKPAYDFFSRPVSTEFVQGEFADNFTPDTCWLTRFSPDGSLVATGMGNPSAEGGVQIWDVKTKKLRSFFPEALHVRCVAFSPDGTRIAIADSTRTARVRSLNSGGVLLKLPGHRQAVMAIDYSPDGKLLVTGSQDFGVRVWDAETGELKWEAVEHALKVYFVRWSPDGKQILSGGQDGRAILWDPATGKPIHELPAKTDVESAVFLPDNKRVITTGWTREATMWDRATGKSLGVFKDGHEGSMLSAAITPDGSQLATGASDKKIVFWDVETQKKLGEIDAHDSNIYGLDFSPDGKVLASASWDMTTRLWDAAKREPIATFSNEEVLVDENDESAEADLAIVVLDVGTHRFATGLESGLVRIRDLLSKRVIHEFRAHEEAVASIRWSPDRKLLATAGYDNRVRLWDTAKFQPVQSFDLPEWALALAFHPDGQSLAAGCYDKQIYRWDLAEKKPLEPLDGHAGGINGIDWSANGKYIASASVDGTIRIWDSQTGKSLKTLAAADEGVNKVVFHPDSQRLASFGLDDNTISIWDWTRDDKPKLAEYQPEQAETFDMALSPNGDVLVHCDEKKITFRNFESGDVQAQLELDTDSCHALGFSAASQQLIAGDWNAKLRLYELLKPAIQPVASLSRPTNGRETPSDREARRWTKILLSPDKSRMAFLGATELEIRAAVDANVVARIVLDQPIDANRFRAAAFSADGKSVVTGSAEFVVVWDVADGKQVRTFKLDTPARFLSVSGNSIVVGSAATVNVLDMQSGRSRAEIKLDGTLREMVVGKDWLITVETSGGMLLRNLQQPTDKPVQVSNQDAWGRIVFDDGAQRFAVGMSGGIAIYDVNRPQERRMFVRTGGEPTDFRFASDNRLVIGLSTGQTVIHDRLSGRSLLNYAKHEHGIESVAVSGQMAATLDSRGQARIWPVNDETALPLVRNWGRSLQKQHCVECDGSSVVVMDSYRYSGQHPLTVEMIVHTFATDGSTLLTDRSWPGDAQSGGIALQVANDHWQFSAADQQQLPAARSDRRASFRAPVHVAGIVENGAVSLFVNGRLQRKGVQLNGDFRPAGQRWSIGGIEESFNGRITALRISKGALYSQDFLPPDEFAAEDNTDVLLHFAEGAGTLAHDASGNGHHATMESVEWEIAKPLLIPTPQLLAETTLETNLTSNRFVGLTSDSLAVANSRTMRVFEMETAKKIHDIIMRDQRALAVAPNRNLVFLAGKRGFRMIETTSGQTVWSSYARADVNIYRAAFTDDETGLLTVHRFRDGRSEVRHRSLDSRRVNWIHKVDVPVTALAGGMHSGAQVVAIARQPDDKPARLEILDVESGDSIAVLDMNPPVTDIKQLMWSSDYTRMVFAMKRGLVQVRDVESLDLVSQVQLETPLASAAFVTGGDIVLHANDGTVSLWGEETGLKNANCAASKITTTTLDPNRRAIVAVDQSGELLVFAAQSSTQIVDAESPLYSIDVLPDGDLITGGTFSADVVRWNPANQLVVSHTEEISRTVVDADIAHDGSCIVVATTDGAVKVFDPQLATMTHVGGYDEVAAMEEEMEFEDFEIDIEEGAADADGADGNDAAAGDAAAGPAEGIGQQPAKADDAPAEDKPAAGAVAAAVNGEKKRLAFRAVAISKDGLIAGGGDEKQLNLWNNPLQDNAQPRHTFFECGFKIRAVAFSPDGKLVAAGGDGPRIQLYNTQTNRLVGELNQGVTTEDLQFVDDSQLLVAAQDGRIRLWDIATRKTIRTYEAHRGAALSLRLNSDGTQFLSGGYDRRVYLWQTDDPSPIARLGQHRAPVTGVAWRTDQLIASVSSDRTLRLASADLRGTDLLSRIRRWSLPKQADVEILDPIARFRTVPRLNSLAIHPRGHVLAAGGDGAAILSADEHKVVKRLEIGKVRSLEFSRDGNWLVTGGKDLRFYDTRNYRLASRLSFDVVRVRFSDNSRLLGVLTKDQYFRVFDVKTRSQLFSGKTDGAAGSLCFSSDGRYAATGAGPANGPAEIHVWSIRNQRRLRTAAFSKTNTNELIRSPISSNQFFASDSDGTLCTWDLRSGRRVKDTPQKNIQSFVFSPNGQRAVSVDDKNRLTIWRTSSFQKSAELTGLPHGAKVTSLQVRPSGESVLIGLASGDVIEWPVK